MLSVERKTDDADNLFIPIKSSRTALLPQSIFHAIKIMNNFHLLGAIGLRRYFSLTILMYHSTECTEYDKQALAAYKSFDDCRLFTDGLTR